MGYIKSSLGFSGDLGIKVKRGRPTIRSRLADLLWQIRYRWENR